MEHRTQIHLSEVDYRRAVRYARQNALSLAGVVREAVAAYLDQRERRDAPGADPIDRLAGLIGPAARPGDLAERHDDYLVAAPPTPRPKRRRAGRT